MISGELYEIIKFRIQNYRNFIIKRFSEDGISKRASSIVEAALVKPI